VNAQNNSIDNMDPGWSQMFRVGGIASLAIGIAYVIIIVLYASVGIPPTGGEARLVYLADKTAAWWAIVGISVFTNFLYVPVSLALYFALRSLNRVAMLLSLAFINLFAILENAVNWTVYGALIMLSHGYVTSANPTERAVFVSAATLTSAILESPLAAVWAIGTLSFAILVTGFVMLKSTFGMLSAYLGIATGFFGLVGTMGANWAIIVNALLTTIWLVLVGYRLHGLARSH
jgi:hypothetical protein